MLWFKQTRHERLANAMLGQSSRKRPKRQRRTEYAVKRKWRWNGESVWAFDKSEARALFKQKHGLKRLPVGAVVELIG